MKLPLIVAVLILIPAAARAQRKDAGGYPAPTAALERGRTTFVLSSCHFCHGADLTGATMGAADLMHSPVVGADTDGNVIGAIVLAGLPSLQTAMPRYKDLTHDQIVDLARYVHYLRQQGRYKELMAAQALPPGDPVAGQALFSGPGGCAKCHTTDLAGIARRYDAPTLRAHLLKPSGSTPQDGVTPTPGVQAHLKLLENYKPEDVQNLAAYLQQLP